MNFDNAFDKLLVFEGGYSNYANDPGGKTKYGITEATARQNGYVGDMQNLTIDVAKSIYKTEYWDAVKAEQLPYNLRFAVFDAAVNSGPLQSIKWLQKTIGVKEDGIIGPITINACSNISNNIVGKFLGYRLLAMTNMKGWPTFHKGWARRIASILID